MPREVLELHAKLPMKYQFVLDIEDVDYDTTINNLTATKKFDHGMLENVEQDLSGSVPRTIGQSWLHISRSLARTDEMYMYLKSRCLTIHPSVPVTKLTC